MMMREREGEKEEGEWIPAGKWRKVWSAFDHVFNSKFGFIRFRTKKEAWDAIINGAKWNHHKGEIQLIGPHLALSLCLQINSCDGEGHTYLILCELHSTTITTSNEKNNHVLMWDGSSPCLVPVPIPVVTAFIKKTLPVLLFSNFIEGRRRRIDSYDFDDVSVDGEKERKEMRCSVCWDCIEGNQEIRELSRCSHVFHKECLDRWVDEGQHTCPLCRSMLLPPNTSPWLVLRN